jgi:NADH-quinone oxidoreductase subunit N
MTLSQFLADMNAILPLAFLMGWACILLLVDLFIPPGRKAWTAFLAALGLGFSLALVILQMPAGPQSAFGGMVSVDGFALFLQVVFLISGLAGIALAYDYLHRMEIDRGEFYTLLLFSIGGMMSMAMANDLIMVFLSLEWLSIPLYILAAFARPRLDSEEAGLKYFLLGAYSGGFVMYGIALVFGATGTTNLTGVLGVVDSLNANLPMLLVGAALILIGLGFKVSAVPFHMWTPDVYHGAPTPVTGFMSVAAKAGGFAALLRVFVVALPALGDYLMPVLWSLAALTMFLGNFAAIAQSNIKRMLAYSSIAHAGYILMALVTYSKPGLAADSVASALFYLVAYAFTSFGAWAVVIALEQNRREGQITNSGITLDDYAGMGRRNPVLAAAMTVFMLSFTGVPPTLGFVGKFYLFRTAIEGGLVGLALIGVLTSLVSAYYYLRVVVIMYMREGEPQVRREPLLNLAIAASAVLVVALSLYAAPLFQWAIQAALPGS